MCCHYWLNGELKRCKYLVDVSSNGLTYCKIYNRRIGVQLDSFKDGLMTVKINCYWRENVHKNYRCKDVECPYNKEGQEYLYVEYFKKN